MNSRFAIIAFAVLIFLAIVVPTEAKEPDELLASIQKCSKALDSCEIALKSVNVSALPVKYAQGARIEKSRTIGLRNVQYARKRINWLNNQISVNDTFNLLDILKNLEIDMDNVTTLLINTYSVPPTGQEDMQSKWIDMLEKATDDLSKTIDDFVDAGDSFTIKIDEKLERCK